MSEMINLAHADIKVATILCNVYSVVENNSGAKIVLMQIKWIRACISYSMDAYDTDWIGNAVKQNQMYWIYYWLKCNRIAILMLMKLVLNARSYVLTNNTTKLHPVAVLLPLLAHLAFTPFSVRISTKSWIYLEFSIYMHLWHCSL